MIEIIGTAAMILAVSGCVANNRQLRWCFILWMISNIMMLGIHINVGVYSLVVRDFVFIILAIEGYYKWGKTK